MATYSGSGATTCTSVIGGTHDDIIVPPGATCILDGVNVRGNVTVQQDAVFKMFFTQVGGNVQGKNADVIQMQFSTVGGNLKVPNAGHPDYLSAFTLLSTVDGNAHINNHRNGAILLQSSQFLGNLHVRGNSGSSFGEFAVDNFVAGNFDFEENGPGGLRKVLDNTVGERLRCRDNAAPFINGPNDGEEEEGCF